MHQRSALILCLFAVLCAGCVEAAGSSPALHSPDYGSAFWEHWGDGRAEIATYDLTFPRYGEPRSGTAVAIFVTEPFSSGAGVKSDRAHGAGVFQALKLNLVKDFPTGLYDYNTMLSAFVALESTAGVTAGHPVKASYSSQEWCGQVYQQVRFDKDRVRYVSHSYFEGEADRDGDLPRPEGGLAEDGLLLWARGLSAPLLESGKTVSLPLLMSLEQSRLAHRQLAWRDATLSRDAATTKVEVPAGTFDADVYRVSTSGGREWTLHVERAKPHRLLRWETSDGELGELVATERLPYWQLNGNRDQRTLERIGLSPRPTRTP